MEAIETVNVHENYMNWGTETRIENLVYLLDNLKKRERNLQHDLVDATDARSGAKELLTLAHSKLTAEEAKISDRIWLIRVLESEVRNVIEQLNDKVQALKRIQSMNIEETSTTSSSSASSSRPASARQSSHKGEDNAPAVYKSPSRNSTSFNFDPACLERESSIRLNKLLNNANSIAVKDLHDRTLMDIRNERSQVQSELLNIIEEREVLMQKLHKIQSLKATATLPPSRPTDKIRMTRSPHLTPPSQAVIQKVDELDRERFLLDDATLEKCAQPRRSSISKHMKAFEKERRSSSVTSRSTSRSTSSSTANEGPSASLFSAESTSTTNSDIYMPITPPFQLYNGSQPDAHTGDSVYKISELESPVRSLKAQSVLSPRASNAITDAQSLLAAGLEKLWSSDKAAMHSIDELGKTVAMREQTLERLENAKDVGGATSINAVAGGGGEGGMGGGGYSSPVAVMFEKKRQNSVVTMSAKKIEFNEEDREDSGEGGTRGVRTLSRTASGELYDIGLD